MLMEFLMKLDFFFFFLQSAETGCGILIKF